MSYKELSLKFQAIGQNVEQLSKFLEQNGEIISKKINDEELINKIGVFNKKYLKTKGIKRFSIPIIGKCNSGKTTFLNYLLHQRNLLEMSEDISTRFICIIRHDPSLQKPEIYDVGIDKRDTLFIKGENGDKIAKTLYNFEEGNKIEKDIEKYIKDKNKKFKSNINKNNINDYFLILKINIPLFNAPELSKYADLFEFMDIPGLSEDNNDFYLKKLFPYFIDNSKFCFFIFDAKDYHGNNPIQIFNNVISLFENKEEVCQNSIFVFNKFDLPEDKKLALNNFEKYLLETLKVPNVDYISCNSFQLLLDVFKYQNYLSYMESIFNEMKKDESNPVNYVKKKLEEDFNIEIEENLDEEKDDKINEGQKQEYKDFLKKTINTINLSAYDYYYYKQYFKKNVKHNESKEIELKIINKINNSFERIINDYINFENPKDLMEKILLNLGVENAKFDNIKFNLKKWKIVGLKQNHEIIFESLLEIAKQLNELKDHKYFEKINEEISLFTKFITREMKLRIPILGCYSCGKSSLLNSLIGNDLLPVSTEVSTNVGLVLSYVDSIENISLSKAYLNKSENIFEEYYYFSGPIKIYSKINYMKEIILLMNNAYLFKDIIVDEIIFFINKLEELSLISDNVITLINNIFIYRKEKNLIELEHWFDGLDIKLRDNLNNIYKKLTNYLNEIIKENKNKENNKYLRNSEKDSFLKLCIPIKAFDELHLSKEEKYQIELIDFPGLNSENNLLDKPILNPLIKFSNGFIFVTRCSINEGDTPDVINTIITKIGNRKMFNFSFDSILFVLTNWENSPNLNLEEKKKDINYAINSGDLSNSFISNQKLLITKFSNNFYTLFLKDKNISEDIIKLYSYLKPNIKYEVNDINFVKKLKKDLKNSFLNKIKNIEENNICIDDEFNSNKNELIKQINPSSLKSEYIEQINEVIKQYMIFKKNINHHQFYINSNAPDFFNQFMKLIKNSRKSYKQYLEKSIIYFSLYLQDKIQKINNKFIFRTAQNFIEEQEKNEKINKITNLSNNKIQLIINKIDSYKKKFEDDISNLTNSVTKKNVSNEDIQQFSGKWKENNDKIQSDIQNDIIDYASEIEEKFTIDISIEANEFEEQEKFDYFDAGHIAAHGIILGLEGVGGTISAIVAANVTAPGIGVAISAGLLIHLGICLIKYKLDRKKEKDRLIESIFNYSNKFLDNLSVFQDEIINLINREKDKIIQQINDNYLIKDLQFDKNEENKLKIIIESFVKKMADNFIIN